jgi:hypothetical protein
MSRLIIASLAILTVLVVILANEVVTLNAKVVIIQAQSASHAEIMVLDRDIRQLRDRVGDLEFKQSAFDTKLTLIDKRQPEVTEEDMKSFASDINTAYKDLESRVHTLEQLDMLQKF